MQTVSLNKALVVPSNGLATDKLSKLKAKLSTSISSGGTVEREVKPLNERIKLGDQSNKERYEIKRSLQKGGMGTVWIAFDSITNQDVALKVLNPGKHGEKTIHRFIREATTLLSISHPNVVPVLDVDESDDYGPYLVMKLIEGETLDSYVKQLYSSNDRNNQKQLTKNQHLQLLKFVAQIADALDTTHIHKIIHRDIKPRNIMISNNIPIIIDFGLAKVEGDSELTSLHNIVGTAAYIAPEQASGQEVDGRADIYSLGVILYELLTGRLPFKGEALKLIKGHQEITPQSPILINPNIDVELNALIIRLLRKDPDERYQSAKELGDELLRITGRIENFFSKTRSNQTLKQLLSSL